MRLLVSLAILLIASTTLAADPEVISKLCGATVMVETENGYGTGVAYRNKDRVFIWTAAHVVNICQSVKTVVDPSTGQPKVQVAYEDVWISQDVVKAGRKVGKDQRLAKIIRFSKEHDLAVLAPYDHEWLQQTTDFNFDIQAVGNPILHIGNFKGPPGAGSYSECAVSAIGRLRSGHKSNETKNPLIYDQFVGIAHKGSSGGGLFTTDGKCVGLVAEFVQDQSAGALCYIPSRRMRDWSEEMNCLWALSPTPVDAKQAAEVITDGTLPLPADWNNTPPDQETFGPFSVPFEPFPIPEPTPTPSSDLGKPSDLPDFWRYPILAN